MSAGELRAAITRDYRCDEQACVTALRKRARLMPAAVEQVQVQSLALAPSVRPE